MGVITNPNRGGAPKGNQNAKLGFQWRNCLQHALATYNKSPVEAGTALHHIAMKVVEQALEGDADARNEIANRLDGKPSQGIDLNANLEGALTVNIRGV